VGVAQNSTNTTATPTDLVNEVKEKMLRAMVCPPSTAPYCPLK
jgi:hypothetical protein